MFSNDRRDAAPTTAQRPLRRRLRTASRAAKVAVAVGVAVITVPFSARADAGPTAAPFPVWEWWLDNTAPPSLDRRGVDLPLLEACPVDGDSTFEDSWGWARSGGRRHKGVDLIAETGTPILAVRDGFAEFKRSGLGGRAVWLLTDDGDKFYYAHLDDWEGESREVEAGDVIGYVGSSGNARGAHLHFETLPDGDHENPFPHTFIACVPPLVNEVARQNSSSALTAERRPVGPSDVATAALRAARDNA